MRGVDPGKELPAGVHIPGYVDVAVSPSLCAQPCTLTCAWGLLDSLPAPWAGIKPSLVLAPSETSQINPLSCPDPGEWPFPGPGLLLGFCGVAESCSGWIQKWSLTNPWGRRVAVVAEGMDP